MGEIKSTEILLQEIKETANIYNYIENHSKDMYAPSFHTYLTDLLSKKKLRTSELIYISGLSRQYTYEILKGRKHPLRNKILVIAFSIGANLNETQRLLTYGGHHPLYAKDMFDSIIIFSIQNRKTLVEVNDILYELSLDILE